MKRTRVRTPDLKPGDVVLCADLRDRVVSTTPPRDGCVWSIDVMRTVPGCQERSAFFCAGADAEHEVEAEQGGYDMITDKRATEHAVACVQAADDARRAYRRAMADAQQAVRSATGTDIEFDESCLHAALDGQPMRPRCASNIVQWMQDVVGDAAPYRQGDRVRMVSFRVEWSLGGEGVPSRLCCLEAGTPARVEPSTPGANGYVISVRAEDLCLDPSKAEAVLVFKDVPSSAFEKVALKEAGA